MGRCCRDSGWIYSIYFYLHHFLRSSAEEEERTVIVSQAMMMTVDTVNMFKLP